jgi:hypothetical protein
MHQNNKNTQAGHVQCRKKADMMKSSPALMPSEWREDAVLAFSGEGTPREERDAMGPAAPPSCVSNLAPLAIGGGMPD